MKLTMKDTHSTARPEIRPYMTIRNCALATGIAEYTLRKLLKDDRLPGFHSGNRYMVDVEGLQTAVREGTI